MKNSILFFGALLLVLSSCCKDRDSDCDCTEPEICIDGFCELPENTVKIGSEYYSGHNVYYAITNDCVCFDTLAFDIIPDSSSSDEYHLNYHIVNAVGTDWRVLHTSGTSGTGEYQFNIGPVCNNMGHQLWSHMIANITPDSINSKFYFYRATDPPGALRDSCAVIFYK